MKRLFAASAKEQTGKAKVLQEAKALFCYEISMMQRHGFEAVNRTLKDIRGDNHLTWSFDCYPRGRFTANLASHS